MNYIVLAALLTFIIFAGVRLAIYPLIHQPDEISTDKRRSMLVELSDIEVLSKAELQEVIKLYDKKSTQKKEYEEYKKFEQILDELKENEFFSEEEYATRLDKLRKKFNVN